MLPSDSGTKNPTRLCVYDVGGVSVVLKKIFNDFLMQFYCAFFTNILILLNKNLITCFRLENSNS